MVERQRMALEHAQWRVDFITSLLATHRALRVRGTHWHDREAELATQLREAEAELKRLQNP